MALPRVNSIAATSLKSTNPKLTAPFLATKHNLTLSHHKQHRTNHSTSSKTCCSDLSQSPRRPEYFPNRIPDNNYVRIMDSTLRDRPRAPGWATTRPEKLAVARKLAELGFDIIKVGSTASSEDDSETSKIIARAVGNFVNEIALVPAMGALARCGVHGDFDAAWEAVRDARRPRLRVFTATSEVLKEEELKKTPKEVLVVVKEGVSFAKSLGCHDIEFVCVDAGRSKKKFLYHVYGEAIKAGSTTITYIDTVGYNLPSEVEQMILDMKASVQGIEDVVIATNFHNGLGLANANSNSLAFAMAVKSRGNDLLGGLHTGINTKHVVPTSKMCGFNLDQKQLADDIFGKFKAVPEMKKFVLDWGTDSFVLGRQQAGHAWKLDDVQVNSHQGQSLPTVNVKLIDARGVEHTASSEAVDQINAAFNAIDLIVKVPVTLVECSTNFDTPDNTLWAQVKVSNINDKQASQNTISGNAQSYYLVESCASAYIDALNQILAFGFPAK